MWLLVQIKKNACVFFPMVNSLRSITAMENMIECRFFSKRNNVKVVLGAQNRPMNTVYNILASLSLSLYIYLTSPRIPTAY